MLVVEPDVIETYVRPGKLKLLFRDVLNHGERSERASEAAACAGQQGRFWQMHELLFENQDAVWSADRDALVTLMLGFGAQIEGLDQAIFARCLNDRAALPALQAADAEQRARGITVQPVFEIEGQLYYGLLSFERLAAIIEEALK